MIAPTRLSVECFSNTPFELLPARKFFVPFQLFLDRASRAFWACRIFLQII